MDSPCACETESLPTEPKQNGESHSEELDHPELVSRVEEIAAEAPKTTEQPAKKSEVKPAKSNKKLKEEEKKLKLLFRNFEGLETPEAKMDALGRKHIQLMSEHKMTGARKEDLETRIEKVMKERDQLQSDFNKASLARSKLESLCRELQRHSKLVKEECQLRAQEEEAKRKELSEKFQTTINDISEQMQENSKANQQLKTENNDLATRLKGLVEQYEVREEHVEKVFKHKQLELQLAEAKMAQQHLQFNEDKEKTLTEKQLLLKQAQEYKKQCEILTKQEKEMKKQLAMYAERFEDFQKTLNKSNEVFGTFKKEMDKMTKTIKKLEKEKSTWKTKCENGNRSLLQMVDEREKHRTEISGLKTKNEKLENLCRALHKAGAKELEKALDKAEQAAAALPSERATVPCVTATALQDVTTECEDTRSHEREQRPVVAEGVESNVDVVEEEEANGDNMNANEIEALEEKLEEFANSFSSDRIQESSDENSQEAADVGTSPTESGESPTDSEESPSTPEETSESPEEVPNESGKSSIEKKEEAADVGTSTESGESPTNGEEWPNKSEETPESSEEAPNDPTESDEASVITTDKDGSRAPDEESS